MMLAAAYSTDRRSSAAISVARRRGDVLGRQGGPQSHVANVRGRRVIVQSSPPADQHATRACHGVAVVTPSNVWDPASGSRAGRVSVESPGPVGCASPLGHAQSIGRPAPEKALCGGGDG